MACIKKYLVLLPLLALAFGSIAQQSSAAETAEKVLTQACIEGNAQAIQSAAMQLATAGTIGADKLEYASNLLSSVEVNGVLFTGSKSDTHPVIMLQFLKNMRTDVRVIEVDWLENASCFQRLQNEIGIEKAGTSGIRLLSRKMPVYVSLAVSTLIIDAWESDLYCTGLAFKCSAAPLANVRGMYNGWWKNCGKTYMASGYSLNANYLAPLAMLADYASQAGNNDEFQQNRQKYAEVAKSVGEKEKIPSLK